MTKKTSFSGAEALFISAFTYALTGILVREVSSMWSDTAQVAVRFLLVLLVLSVYTLISKKTLFLKRDKLKLILALGLAFVLMVVTFTVALGKTTVANVLFVFYATNMISAFVLGTILLKESVTRSKVIALIFALIGLTVYSQAVLHGNLGIIFSIVAGVGGGFTSLVSKQLNGVDRNTVLIGQYVVATIFALVMVVLSGQDVVRVASWHASLLTLLFALVIILGSYLMLYGFQNFDVNIGTVIMSTEIIFASIMAYFLFNEVPKAHELIGGLLIFAGSVVGSGIFDRSREAQPATQPD